MDLNARSAPLVLKSLSKNMTKLTGFKDCLSLLLRIGLEMLEIPRLHVQCCASGEVSFTKVSGYVFQERLPQSLKNIGYKTTTDWLHSYYELCWLANFTCRKPRADTVLKYCKPDFLRESPFLELGDKAKHDAMWSWQSQNMEPRGACNHRTWSYMQPAVAEHRATWSLQSEGRNQQL